MIEINNLTSSRICEDSLKKIAKKVLDHEGKEKFELSIALVGESRIRALNKKYRKKNKITDVLSFLYGDSGEIVICLREVKKNAKKIKSDYKKELAKVLIHGILHLIGYGHEKSNLEAEKMEKKERYYILIIDKLSYFS